MAIGRKSAPFEPVFNPSAIVFVPKLCRLLDAPPVIRALVPASLAGNSFRLSEVLRNAGFFGVCKRPTETLDGWWRQDTIKAVAPVAELPPPLTLPAA
jgi:hypothetical protein